METGIDRGDHGLVVVIGNLSDRLPIGEDKAAEAQFALEHVGQQVAVGVHPAPAPTAERGHDAERAVLEGLDIGRQMDRPQGNLVHLRHVLVQHVLLLDIRPFCTMTRTFDKGPTPC